MLKREKRLFIYLLTVCIASHTLLFLTFHLFYTTGSRFSLVELFTTSNIEQCLDNSSNVFNMYKFDHTWQMFTNNTQLLKLIEPQQKLTNFDKLLYNSHKQLKRALSSELKYKVIELLNSFVSMLKNRNISFGMSYGTLLGSYYFHDIIPWDDDLDLWIDSKDINKLRAIFRTKQFYSKYRVCSSQQDRKINVNFRKGMLHHDIPLNNFFTCGSGTNSTHKCYQTIKVYPISGIKAKNLTWNFPFIDIVFMLNNGTHVYNLENPVWPSVVLAFEDFYPSILRPFNTIWLPAPKHTKKYLHARYTRKFRCIQHVHDHIKETTIKERQRLPCQLITGCYAHVQRRPALHKDGTVIEGQVIEDLVLADVVLQSVLINDSFTGADKLDTVGNL